MNRHNMNINMLHNSSNMRPGGFNQNNILNSGSQWSGNRGSFDYRPPGPPPDFFQCSRPPAPQNAPMSSNRFGNSSFNHSFRPPYWHQNVPRSPNPPFMQQSQRPPMQHNGSSTRGMNFNSKRGVKRNFNQKQATNNGLKLCLEKAEMNRHNMNINMLHNSSNMRPGGFNQNNILNSGSQWSGNRGSFDYRPPGPPPDFFQCSRPPAPQNAPMSSNRFGNSSFNHSFRPPYWHQNVPRSPNPPFMQQSQRPPMQHNGSSTRGMNFNSKRGVKRNFNQKQATNNGLKKPKVDKRDLPENNKFVCEACDRGYKNEDAYKLHCDQHEKCKEEGCGYIAAPKLVQLHYQWQHRTGLAKKIWQLESKEDLEKWREERRKNYPTKETIEKKKKVLAEKIARGEVIETRTFGKMRGQNRKCQRVKNFLQKANAELNNAEKKGRDHNDDAEQDEKANGREHNRNRKRRRRNRRKASEGSQSGEKDVKKGNSEESESLTVSGSEDKTGSQNVPVPAAHGSDSEEDNIEITAVTKMSDQQLDPLSIIVIGDETSSSDEEPTPVTVKTEKVDTECMDTEPVKPASNTAPVSGSIPGSIPSATVKTEDIHSTNSRSLPGALGALASLYGDDLSDSDTEDDTVPQQQTLQDKESVAVTNQSSTAPSSNSQSGTGLLKTTERSNANKSAFLNSDHKKGNKDPCKTEKIDQVQLDKKDNVKINRVHTNARDRVHTNARDRVHTNTVGDIVSKNVDSVQELELNRVRVKAGQNDSVTALTEDKFKQFCGCLTQNKLQSNESENETKNIKSETDTGGKKSGKTKQDFKVEKKNRFKQRPAVSKKRLTLLQKLLAPDIRHERNVVMQCIRHIVKKDFFGLAKESAKVCNLEKTFQKKREVDDELWEGEGVF